LEQKLGDAKTRGPDLQAVVLLILRAILLAQRLILVFELLHLVRDADDVIVARLCDFVA
jgi:hypothetical protein